MRVAVITVAGISSRFNEGIEEQDKKLKCIYYADDKKNTLLYHMLCKLSYADKIVVVGGYKYDELKSYIDEVLPPDMHEKIILVMNEHYEDYASGYSLYMGLKTAFDKLTDIEDILFVEGDLDIDKESVDKVIDSYNSILTYNNEPIYSKSAVVLYQDEGNLYHYAFNSSHGTLKIDEPFKCILNSGQLWKFTDIDVLRKSNEIFEKNYKMDTNLRIIQDYVNEFKGNIEVINLKRWTNCNTRADFGKIRKYWEDEI